MEDAQFIIDNSTVESYLFLVDSAQRDKYMYPDSNTYAIEFNAPFRNVCGLELVNATVPRSEYTLETDENTLKYVVGNGTVRVLTVPEGDYNLVQLCHAVDLALLDGLHLEPYSDPYQMTSRSRMYSDNPFKILAAGSGMLGSLGFHGTDSEYASSPTGTVERQTHSGPFPESLAMPASTTVSQPFVPVETGVPSRVSVYAKGDVNVTVIDSAGTVYGTAVIDSSVSSIARVAGGVSISSGTQYYLIIQGADVFVGVPASSSGQTIPGSQFAACCQVFVDVSRHELVSPGIADLTGTSHVLVRCPEIESYIHRDRMSEMFHSGMGMVKLGVSGIAEQRMDFVSFPPRTLSTPISKISKLSFKLERPDGSLYVTRGLDHTLLLVIRYHVAKTSRISDDPLASRRLNPEYVPDMTAVNDAIWKRESESNDRFGVIRDRRGF